MPKRPPPVQNLSEYADEHLLYEARMFLFGLQVSPSSQFEMNAKIEIVVLHLRNLIDFFYLGNLRTDDVTAANYVDDWKKRDPLFLKSSIEHGSAPIKSWRI